jgi:hypothetical protein
LPTALPARAGAVVAAGVGAVVAGGGSYSNKW